MIARYAMDRYDKQLADQVCEWFKSNGIEPTDVPLHSTVVVTDGQITYERTDRDDRGQMASPYATTRETVPLLVPMPDELDARADWRIAPRLCDRCQADLEETP